MPDRTALRATRRAAVAVGGVLVAAVVVAGATVLPLPALDATPAGRLVEPVPVDQVRVCPGSVLRLSDEDGGAATTSSALGEASVTSSSSLGDVDEEVLAGADGASSRPTALTAPVEDGEVPLLSGAQSQLVDEGDLYGFTAAACAEPTSSTWLVGGSTRTGRVTLVTLVNPTDVNSTVDLGIVAEQGQVQGPGIDGIVVAPRTQKVVPLAGFATGLSSPVVHVTSRGGPIVANLQESIVRTLQPGGADVVSASAGPARTTVVPGIVVRDGERLESVVEPDEADDASSVLRVLVPGAEAADVTVTLAGPSGDGTTFDVRAEGGRVTDLPVDGLPDGRYTATLRSSVPVVAGARTSTATPDGQVDVAWAPSAAALTGDVQVSVGEGEGAALTLANPGEQPVTTTLVRGDDETEVAVAPGSSVDVRVGADDAFVLRDPQGLRAAVSWSGDGRIAAWSVVAPLPASTPVVVHP
ncbi:DUF5719 family protein [Frigoribacterium salinisoli]